ncbi:MAG: nucleotidyltransferase family protein [archaeon]
MNKKQNFEALKQKILPILKSHKVTKASIFGSYARGEQNKKSDVDILIEIDNSVGLIEFIGLKLMLQKTLKKKVDLVEYETIRPELKENIMRDEISILA